MSARTEKKIELFDRMYDLMNGRPDLCGDDVHKVEAELFQKMTGKYLTKEEIILLYSIIRMRRNVLVKHPELDTRVKTKPLQAEDTKFYRKKRYTV